MASVSYSHARQQFKANIGSNMLMKPNQYYNLHETTKKDDPQDQAAGLIAMFAEKHWRCTFRYKDVIEQLQ